MYGRNKTRLTQSAVILYDIWEGLTLNAITKTAISTDEFEFW